MRESLFAGLSRDDKERRRDQEAEAAERLLYGTAVADPLYAASMTEAAAHAMMASYWQALIEWEHGVGF